MSITRHDPNTIHLGGEIVRVNDITASTTVTPGHAIARSGGQYGLHSAAQAGPLTLALNVPEMNKDLDDNYASGDLMFAGVFPAGSAGLAWLASGENVTDGALLESAGSGKLRALASGVALARAIENKDARYPTGDTRIRVEAV